MWDVVERGRLGVARWRHLRKRVRAIQRELDAAPSGSILLAGNSHAELLRWPRFGQAVVNGGIGGATAASYARMTGRLRIPAPAGLALLLIGTNDIVRQAEPLGAEARVRFTAAAARLLGWLAAHAERVLVAAVPPIGCEAALQRDPAAVAVYSDVLRALCEQEGGHFVDPFAGIRDGTGGLALAGTLVDGVHLADYSALARTLDPVIRAALAGPP